jgi:hypothetical protein
LKMAENTWAWKGWQKECGALLGSVTQH